MRIQINKLGLEYPNFRFPKEFDECSGSTIDRRFRVHKRKYLLCLYCLQCATEVYGIWKFYETEFYLRGANYGNPEYSIYTDAEKQCRDYFRLLKEQEILPIAEGEQYCPLCGKELPNMLLRGHRMCSTDARAESYLVLAGKTTSHPNVDFSYDMIRKNRSKDEERDSREKVARLVAQYEKLDILNDYDLSHKTKIVNDQELLKEYLLLLIKLESNIRSVSERLVQLYVEKTESDRLAYQSELLSSRTVKNEIDEAQNHYQECVLALKNIENLEMSKSGFSIPDEPKKPNEPCYEKVSIFNRKKAEAHNQLLKQQYEMACAEYDNSMQVYLQEVQRIKKAFEEYVINRRDEAQKDVDDAKRNLDILSKNVDVRTRELLAEPTPEKIIKGMVDKEVDDAEKLLKELIECKNKLYGFDVVFEKYRDIVALSSFYEYLIAGRCDSLSGANGAYNIYENEARAKQIITKLVEISETLEEIRDSQYMIYSELCSINSNLSDLKESMNEAMREIKSGMGVISKQLEDISYYTKATAYYSKMNASLTNAIGFMIALN